MNKTSSYEPLSEEELRPFSDVKQNHENRDYDSSHDQPLTTVESEYEDANTNNTLNIDTTDDNEANSNLSKDKKTGAVRGRQVSSVKLFIIGVVCGLLLSSAIVAVLSNIGVLSVLSDNVAADDYETITPSAPAAPVSQPSTEETVNQEAVAATFSDKAAISNKNTETAEQVAPTIAEPKKINSNTTNDSAISIEDFREEAQNTLYRETKD
ncbi:hypothetical protein [Psychrobacter urativorans]|uniref:hypothetical protein n=1 Tax=Psychrobacter urativorans TaxID=45610 RepID=UPI001918C20A|nr:hypothetical protein [Psychrobacter urativorans]